MKKDLFSRVIGVIVIIAFYSSCVGSTKMIVTAVEPNGKPVENATVLIDGKNIGQTPTNKVKVSNFVGNDTIIVVSKDGYYTSSTSATKEVKAGNIVLGILLNIFAFLWVSGPKALQNVVLIPEASTAQ